MTKAVVLLSGGLDSLLALDQAKADHESDVVALYIDYGQPTEAKDEEAVACIAEICSVQLERMHLQNFGLWEKAKDSVGYYPQRNLFLLTMGAMLCDTVGAHDLYFGAQGYLTYPDCIPSWLNDAIVCINQGRKDFGSDNWINLRLPALHMTKAQIIQRCMDFDLPVELTVACYDDMKGVPCGVCPGCFDRQKAFIELDLVDPALVRF